MSNTSMASMGCVNFMSRGTVSVRSGRDLRPRFSFQAYRPSISLGCAGSEDPGFGSSREDCVRFSLRSRRQGLRSWGLKAMGEGSEEGEESDKIENAFDATIEESKKVLDMQRNLLQQVIFVIFLV